jgi:hypothetical protein
MTPSELDRVASELRAMAPATEQAAYSLVVAFRMGLAVGRVEQLQVGSPIFARPIATADDAITLFKRIWP